MTSYYYGQQSPCPKTSKICPCGNGAIAQSSNCPCGNDATAQSSNTCCSGTYTQGCGCCSGGSSSVLLSSGLFSFKRDLLAISAINGISWGFGLDYLAQNGINGILGKSFNYPQNLQLQPAQSPLPNTDVVLFTGQNTTDVFTQVSSTTYAAASGNTTMANLFRSGSGRTDQFTLISSAGAITNFFGFDATIATPGCVQSVTDRYGNNQTYNWQNVGGVNQLVSVTDSYSRTINYTYYGAESNYLLQQIEDFLGRQLNFQYDEFNHLVAVITPSINQAAQGNTFPGGTAYVFRYDVNNPRPERRDDLINIWFPNEATPFIDTATRTIDVEQVYQSATPRYTIEYGQDPTDPEYYGLVVRETIGDPTSGIGGTFRYQYTTPPATITNPFADDPDDNTLNFRCIVTDRNDNQTAYDFNAVGMPVRTEVIRTRSKIDIPSLSEYPSYITWTSYNSLNQPKVVIYPLGNSVEYTYENGQIPAEGSNPGFYANQRNGLLLSRTQMVGNSYGIAAPLPASPGTSSSYSSPAQLYEQSQLSELYFYDPIFNQQCAMVERRGNAIDASGDFFVPQNGGSTSGLQSRYATITYFDFQKDTQSTVDTDPRLIALVGSTANIDSMISFVSNQLTAIGLSAFSINLGDINGDGTGNGAGSGLPNAPHIGNVVKIQPPEVTLVQSGESSGWTPNQPRLELFTTNARGQTTTHTDPQGNLTVYVRYPFNDPEGNGGVTDPTFGTSGGQQYGRLKEIHVDADPNDVQSMVGNDGDLVDFISNIISRTNTPNVYQDLVTRYEGGSGASGSGCASCAYDALGNPLAQTDPRGFTTRYDRNELGEAYRSISPQPYNCKAETHFDANRNVVRIDTEDRQPAYDSCDPSSACYAQFSPSGSGGTAHVPMRPGPGGAVRPGWFTDLYQFDLLDNKIEDNIDATGSTPASLITTYQYDPNQNLILITKPEGNIVEYDYDERNLRIAMRVGMVPGGEPGSISIAAFDANDNLLETIGPADRGGNTDTAVILDAFRSGTRLTHVGDLVANTFDGFNRLLTSTDPLSNFENSYYDPDGRVILKQTTGADGYEHFGVLLASGESRYDEAGRQYETQQQVFVPNTSSLLLPSERTVTQNFGSLATNSLSPRSGSSNAIVSSGYGTGPGDYNCYVLTRTIYDSADRVVSVWTDNNNGNPQTTTVYDGANRAIQTTDAPGNVLQNTFDANGNVILSVRNDLCTISGVSTVETFQSAMLYDSLNRLVVQAQQGADGTLDLNLLNCGSDAIWQVPSDTIIGRMGYDSRGNQCLMIDPKGNSSLTVFDGASRQIQTQQHLRIAGQGSNPPVANQTNLALILSSQLPASTGSLSPGASACILSTLILDGNGRRTQLIDDRGDITLLQYDTLDRPTVMTFHDGSTRINQYDEAGDVITYKDENGSMFSSTFDALGRKTAVLISPADGVAGNPGSGVDGSISQAFAFDGLSRMTSTTDTKSNYFSGGGTIAGAEIFYDSIGRVLEESQSYAGNTRNVTNTAFASYPASNFAFPEGRVLANTYDLLYRRTLVQDVTNTVNVAAWQFFGSSRMAEVTPGAASGSNNLVCTWMNNVRMNSAVQPTVVNPAWGTQSSDRLGYDGAGRPITKRYLLTEIESGVYTSTAAVVGFTTEYDLASNKFYERALHAPDRSSLYEPFSNGSPTGGYDSMDRLRQYQRGVLTTDDGFAGNGGGSVATPTTLPGANSQRTYDLDSLGNWRRTNYTVVLSPESSVAIKEIRQHNGLNQITRVSEGGSPTDFAYDGAPGASNGNLVNDGIRSYVWDALNRLIVVNKTPNTEPVLIATYAYDALNRRIRKLVSNGGIPNQSNLNGTTDSIYLGWRCIEERDGSNNPLKQFIWGVYLDECLQMLTLQSITTGPSGSQTTYAAGAYYPLQDLLSRSMALANSSGNIVEAYDYDAYGNSIIFNAPGPDSTWWTDEDQQVPDNLLPFLFTGQRFDAETQIYYYKFREMIPALGRFVARDPAGQHANLYDYVGCRAPTVTDALGLFDIQSWLRSFTGNHLSASFSGELIPPIPGPYGLSLHVTGTGEIEYMHCCQNNRVHERLLIDGTIEIYGELGFAIANPKPRHAGRNQKIPDPWNPGKLTKWKKAKTQPAPGGFRTRWLNVGGKLCGLPECSTLGIHVSGSLFFRGSAGWIAGAQFNIHKPITSLQDLENITSGWEVEGDFAAGVYGASLELGVGVTIEGVFWQRPTDRCC